MLVLFLIPFFLWPAQAPKLGPPKERVKWEFGRKSNVKGRLLLSTSFLAVAVLAVSDLLDKSI